MATSGTLARSAAIHNLSLTTWTDNVFSFVVLTGISLPTPR